MVKSIDPFNNKINQQKIKVRLKVFLEKCEVFSTAWKTCIFLKKT